MRKITCYIRRNRVHSDAKHRTAHLKIYPWVMETYPDYKNRNKVLHRRDFECRSIEEAEKIAICVYGDNARILMDSPFVDHEE